MLVLSAIWIAYTVYKTISLVVRQIKFKDVKLHQMIDLFCDFCLAAIMLCVGLTLSDYIKLNIFVVGGISMIYMLGKVLEKKLMPEN